MSLATGNRILLKKALINFLITIFLSIAINAAIFYFGIYFNWIPTNFIVEGTSEPLGIKSVTIATIIGAFLGLIFLLIIKALSPEKAFTSFRYIALTGLMLSFFSPFSLDNPKISFILCLELMHIVSVVLMIMIMAGRSRE